MPRVLCLHGSGTSADILKKQLTSWSPPPDTELVYKNGQEQCPPFPGIEKYFPGGPYYRFVESYEAANLEGI